MLQQMGCGLMTAEQSRDMPQRKIVIFFLRYEEVCVTSQKIYRSKRNVWVYDADIIYRKTHQRLYALLRSSHVIGLFTCGEGREQVD